MKGANALGNEVAVHRTDPVYNAHSYLTKIPVTAIQPFIEAFSKPGDLVLDVFAGSGMTGIAAAMLGRRAVLSDISTLGEHIGRNYLNLVNEGALLEAALEVIRGVTERLGDVYGVQCASCGADAQLSKTTWSVVVGCLRCGEPVNFYRALEAADWRKDAAVCPQCLDPVTLRCAPRLSEEPVLDTTLCSCSRTLIDQAPTRLLKDVRMDGLRWPETEIDSTRQMFQVSALAKHNLVTVSSFFSGRNLGVLAALREEISNVPDHALREKLLFGFTAILARASKRYQWSRQRPLNAATQHYYIAPVFYEWNVFDLFQRKVKALTKSDAYIRQAMGGPLFGATPDVEYRLASADDIDLPNDSVDYVFTDPPFGSNIFYSDMNLFQEAWLGRLTDTSKEAVVDRATNNKVPTRTAGRYEEMLTRSFMECHRVLKPEGRLSLVFSNSSGPIWALLQRAIRMAGFAVDPNTITLLDKGQRSVKGLASGFEDIVTVDLVLTLRKRSVGELALASPTHRALDELVDEAIAGRPFTTPSHAYQEVIRECLRRHWDLTEVSFSAVRSLLAQHGYATNERTGRFVA